MARATPKEPDNSDETEFRFADPGSGAGARAARREEGSEGANRGSETDKPGVVNRLASWTASAPLLGQLGGFSFTLALRWLFWLLAVLLCLGGMAAMLAGTGLGYVALGSVSGSITPTLDSASTAMTDASASISGFGSMAGQASNSTSTISLSLRNLSIGLGGAGDTLQTLTAIPVLGAQLGGLSNAAGQIKQSASGLNSAADQLDAAGNSGASATTTLYAVSADLSQMATNLQNAKATVQNVMGTLQLAVLAAGFAMELLFMGTLCLALAYGPPKR